MRWIFFSSPFGNTAVMVMTLVPSGMLWVSVKAPVLAGVTTSSNPSVDTMIVDPLMVLPLTVINFLLNTSSSFGESIVSILSLSLARTDGVASALVIVGVLGVGMVLVI